MTRIIDLDEGICSVELLQDTAEFFALSARQARAIIHKVAEVSRTWRAVAE